MNSEMPAAASHAKEEYAVRKSDAQWRNELSDLEFAVLRQASTERPGTGALLEERRAGTYFCRGCGAELFRSETKFDSFCGWPSFFDPNEKNAVEYIHDYSHGMVRTEVRCARCGSHLGHVFPDAPHTPTGLRYCMNSVSLTFQPDSNADDQQLLIGAAAEGTSDSSSAATASKSAKR